jgi:hypothetical protein
MLLADLADQAVQAGGLGLSWTAFISERRGSSASSFAGAARPCVCQARTSQRGPLAGT